VEGESLDYLRIIYSFLLVIGLMLICAKLWQRFGVGKVTFAGNRRENRLQLIEAKVVDARRKLLLLRCDDKEYLVLMGPNQDIALTQPVNMQPVNLQSPQNDASTQASGTLLSPLSTAAEQAGELRS
jgi:flagellar protein FliO/FliZ